MPLFRHYYYRTHYYWQSIIIIIIISHFSVRPPLSTITPPLLSPLLFCPPAITLFHYYSRPSLFSLLLPTLADIIIIIIFAVACRHYYLRHYCRLFIRLFQAAADIIFRSFFTNYFRPPTRYSIFIRIIFASVSAYMSAAIARQRARTLRRSELPPRGHDAPGEEAQDFDATPPPPLAEHAVVMPICQILWCRPWRYYARRWTLPSTTRRRPRRRHRRSWCRQPYHHAAIRVVTLSMMKRLTPPAPLMMLKICHMP